jgi:hypothetical protein
VGIWKKLPRNKRQFFYRLTTMISKLPGTSLGRGRGFSLPTKVCGYHVTLL